MTLKKDKEKLLSRFRKGKAPDFLRRHAGLIDSLKTVLISIFDHLAE